MDLRIELKRTLEVFRDMGNDKQGLQLVALAWMLNHLTLDFDVNAVVDEVFRKEAKDAQADGLPISDE